MRRQYFDIVSPQSPPVIRPATLPASTAAAASTTIQPAQPAGRAALPIKFLRRFGWLALPTGLLLLIAALALAVLSSVAPSPSSPPAAANPLSGQSARLSPDTLAAAAGPTTFTPWRLDIPTLNLNAAIQSVGTTPDGDMAVPSNYTDVGWYRAGARPGTPGTAVLAGHLSAPGNQPAVFSFLRKLRPGDQLSITETGKPPLRFKVTRTQTYDTATAPRDSIFTSPHNAAPRLNLITCAGQWDQQAQDYTHRLIVFTELAR